MKQLTCEMCGSTDLMKQDGVFVCQSCGTKYSVEEAKKMMVEGTVSVVGTVTIDNSASYDRILELARDAYNDKRFESAYDYYCQAVDIHQDVVENVLRQGLSILAKDGVQSSVPSSCVNRVSKAIDLMREMPDNEEKDNVALSAIADLDSACEGAKNLLREEIADLELQKMKTRSAGDILADLGRPQFVASQNQAEDKKIERHNKAIDEKIAAVRSRMAKIDAFASEYTDKIVACANINAQFKYYYTNSIDRAVEIYPHVTLTADEQKELTVQTNQLYSAVARKKVEQVKMLVKMGADVNEKGGYSNTSPVFAITAYKCTEENRSAAIEILKLLLNNGAKIDCDEHAGERTLLNTDSDEEIKKIIIEKAPEMANKITMAPKASSGCYVATAVYGSYNCPQVWTLRRYRDYTLAETWYGRAFIHTYYAISPTLVKWFGHTEWFKKMWKGKLDRMVANLNAEGVEDTPYEDKEW